MKSRHKKLALIGGVAIAGDKVSQHAYFEAVHLPDDVAKPRGFPGSTFSARV